MRLKNLSLILAFGMSALSHAEGSLIVYHDANILDIAAEEAFKVTPITSSVSRVTGDDPSLRVLQETLRARGVESEFEDPFKLDEPTPYSLQDGEISTQSLSSFIWNDPQLPQQVELISGVNSIYSAISSQKRAGSKVNVAILDSGALPHEDLLIAGGYSLTTMFGQVANDDYTAKTTSYGKTCSSAHGINMAGIIGATRNNSKGIAGIADANLYMGRVLSTDCNDGTDVGYLSDVAQGIYWAIGQNNKNIIPKADVINISVAAVGVCPKVLQDAINAANTAGSIVVVSAGNYSSLVTKYAPANCQGVVVVGAHSNSGKFSDYSNYGDKVDVAIEGERLTTGISGYERVTGTSGAAAAVTGTLAALRAYFPQAKVSELLAVYKSALKEYEQPCAVGCGLGMVDLNAIYRRAEKVLDPVFVADHLYSASTCFEDREVEAVSNVVDACGAYMVKSQTSFLIDDTNKYQFKLMSRSSISDPWLPTSTKYDPVLNTQRFMIPGYRSDQRYGVAACDGDYCPFVREIDVSSVKRPALCK